MCVEEIEAAYASKDLGLSEVDGTTCEVAKKVDTTEDAELGEALGDDDDDYDYNFWKDFVLKDCEWDDKKDEDEGAGGGERGGGRTTKTNGGVCGEVASITPSGSSDPSSTKDSGSAANKQRTARIVCCATAKAISTFKDYIDDARDYIVSSMSVVEDIDGESNYSGDKKTYRVPDTMNHSDPSEEEDLCVDSSSQRLILVTPPKLFNKHHREVDGNDDFLDSDKDFVDPVPLCVFVRTHT